MSENMVLFDLNELDAGTVTALQQLEGRIHGALMAGRQAIFSMALEVGGALVDAEQLFNRDPKKLESWVGMQFGLNLDYTTARKWMNYALGVQSCPKLLELRGEQSVFSGAQVLASALMSSQINAEVIDAVVVSVNSGEKLTQEVARDIIGRHRVASFPPLLFEIESENASIEFESSNADRSNADRSNARLIKDVEAALRRDPIVGVALQRVIEPERFEAGYQDYLARVAEAGGLERFNERLLKLEAEQPLEGLPKPKTVKLDNLAVDLENAVRLNPEVGQALQEAVTVTTAPAPVFADVLDVVTAFGGFDVFVNWVLNFNLSNDQSLPVSVDYPECAFSLGLVDEVGRGTKKALRVAAHLQEIARVLGVDL